MLVKNGGLWWKLSKNPLKHIQETVSTIRTVHWSGILEKTWPKSVGRKFAVQKKKLNPLTHDVLRGSGYLGYVDSNQGYNPYK